MWPTPAAAAGAVVRCCRRLWAAGLIAGADGNVSVRVAADRVLVTPAGMLKADLRTADLVEVDLDGRAISGTRRASSELDLHLALYQHDPACRAIVHAHPPFATAHAVTGVPLEADALPELLLLLGRSIPIAPFAVPGTRAVGASVVPYAATHRAVLLANHGAVTWGGDLRIAQIRMESLEHGARILSAARALGEIRRLPTDVVNVLDPRDRRMT